MTLASSPDLCETDIALPHAPHLLVLDAARRDAQWAVFDAQKQRVLGARIRDRAAAERLAPEVEAGLAALGIAPAALGAVIVGIGPGSYAGLRIALAFAKGMAEGAGLPLVSVPSMEAMLADAAQLPAATEPVALALLNAFAGLTYAHGPGVPTDAYAAADLRVLAAGKRALVDGALPGIDALGLLDVVDLRAQGCDLPLGALRLGAARFLRGERAALSALVPDYGRPSSAEVVAAKRLGP